MPRTPYASPQTPMEIHIAECVEHLNHSVDNRSGFAQTIERTMAHAYWLEAECERLRKENQEWEEAFILGLPKIQTKWSDKDLLLPNNIHAFEWHVESFRWRTLLEPHHSMATKKTWDRIRRNTFKAFCRLMRKEFERTFPLKIS